MTRNSVPNARRWLAGAYLLVVLIATWQRGVASQEHTTFAIFRQSYIHLVQRQDLYAIYPAEHGAASQDIFKYSPTAAVLFAPLSVFPYAIGLLLWNILNAAVLFRAVTRVLPERQADIALVMLLPEVFTTIQASSSNALVAALMLFGMRWIIQGRHVRAALMIATGAAIKIFPVAAAVVILTRGDRRRFSVSFALWSVVLFVLPLAAVSVHDLSAQYHSWWLTEQYDANDIQFGVSLMRAVREFWEISLPNWALQGAGSLMVLIPLLRRDQWDDESFQNRFVASILIFVVLFNHQAERQSLVIAAVGCSLWLAARPLSISLAFCYVLALTGASILPYALLWVVLQGELLGPAPARLLSSFGVALARLRNAVLRPVCGECGMMVSWIRPVCASCRTPVISWLAYSPAQLTGRMALFAALADLVTAHHFVIRWSLWDLLR